MKVSRKSTKATPTKTPTKKTRAAAKKKTATSVSPAELAERAFEAAWDAVLDFIPAERQSADRHVNEMVARVALRLARAVQGGARTCRREELRRSDLLTDLARELAMPGQTAFEDEHAELLDWLDVACTDTASDILEEAGFTVDEGDHAADRLHGRLMWTVLGPNKHYKAAAATR